MAKQLSNPTNIYYIYYLNEQYTNLLTFERIDEESLSKTINYMQPKISCGYDGISLRLLKLVKHAVIKSLPLITNQILATGIFPDKLKITKVIPIKKR